MWREKESEKKKKKKNCVQNKWALVSCFFLLSMKGITVLLICQGDNLVGGRIDDLLKGGHCPV